VRAVSCPQNLLLPFYEHFEAFAFRIWESAKPDLNRTWLEIQNPEAQLDIIVAQISSPIANPQPRSLLYQVLSQKKG
jgi:hypothetical protein